MRRFGLVVGLFCARRCVLMGVRVGSATDRGRRVGSWDRPWWVCGVEVRVGAVGGDCMGSDLDCSEFNWLYIAAQLNRALFAGGETSVAGDCEFSLCSGVGIDQFRCGW